MTDGVAVQHLLRERVAEEVRALLARKMMTGADLAAAIGRSPMYVSRRVRGEVAFDLDDMERLAGVFGVAVADLLPPSETAARAEPRVIKTVFPSLPVPAASADERPMQVGPFSGGRKDSVRPTSAVPATKRRPVRTRSSKRPGSR